MGGSVVSDEDPIDPDSLTGRIGELVTRAYMAGWQDSRKALMYESLRPTVDQMVRHFKAWATSPEGLSLYRPGEEKDET